MFTNVDERCGPQRQHTAIYFCKTVYQIKLNSFSSLFSNVYVHNTSSFISMQDKRKSKSPLTSLSSKDDDGGGEVVRRKVKYVVLFLLLEAEQMNGRICQLFYRANLITPF